MVLARALQAWLKTKPLPDALQTGEKIGRILYRIAKTRRRRTLDNLALAFPEKLPDEREQIAKGVFESFARSSVDFLLADDRSPQEALANIDVTGLEHVQAAKAAGKGALLITGHIGNWERLAAYMSYSGYTLHVVTRDADDHGFNEIVNKIRRGPGTTVIPRGDAARPILQRLKENEFVGILPDQNSHEAFIPFFGHPAGTVLGPGVIHARTNCPVICGYCVYIGDGRYRAVFTPPLEPLPGYETKGEGLMRAVNAWLESVIREYPDQWLWMHDRWRNARKKGLL